MQNKDIDIDLVNFNGQTALDIAKYRRQNQEMVKLSITSLWLFNFSLPHVLHKLTEAHWSLFLVWATRLKKRNKSGLFSCPYRILDYFSDIMFTFSTTFILITKLKSLSVLNLSVCQSVCLSVCLYFCLSTIFLTSSWHSEHLLFWWVSWKIFLEDGGRLVRLDKHFLFGSSSTFTLNVSRFPSSSEVTRTGKHII